MKHNIILSRTFFAITLIFFVGFQALSESFKVNGINYTITNKIKRTVEVVKGGEYFGPIQFSSVAQSCPTLCNPMNRSMPGLHVHHQLPEFTQTHVHRVSDAIQELVMDREAWRPIRNSSNE